MFFIMKKDELPNIIPVFPLSNFIVLPKTTVPINIFDLISNFEQRLQMIKNLSEKTSLMEIEKYNKIFAGIAQW